MFVCTLHLAHFPWTVAVLLAAPSQRSPPAISTGRVTLKYSLVGLTGSKYGCCMYHHMLCTISLPFLTHTACFVHNVTSYSHPLNVLYMTCSLSHVFMTCPSSLMLYMTCPSSHAFMICPSSLACVIHDITSFLSLVTCFVLHDITSFLSHADSVCIAMPNFSSP